MADAIERELIKRRLEVKKQEFIFRNKSHEVRKLEMIIEAKRLDKEIEVNKQEIEKVEKELLNYQDIP